MPIARFKGTIVEWNESRGFGFIQPAAGGARVFCHVTAFRNRSESPALNRVVVYELGRDERGRPQAKRIQYAGAASRRFRNSRPGIEFPSNEKRPDGPPRTGLALAGAITFAAVLVMLFIGGQVPWFVLPWYVFLSVVSVALYAWDKSSAEGRHWRIKESTLNTLALLGGWPGAWIAQQAYRHKSRKASFQSAFWSAVILNIAMLAGFVYLGPGEWDATDAAKTERTYKQP